jgi:hypothetical protein
MAAYLAAVMAVPVARQQRGRQRAEAAADKGAAAPGGGGGAAHGLHRQQQQQEEAVAGSSAGPPRAAVAAAVAAAAAEPVLAALQTDALQQPTTLSAAPEAAPGLRPTASAAQQLQRSDISSGGGSSASAGSGPTAKSLALSVAAGSLACTLGSLGAAALGNASLALMLMALVAAALGSAASIASPGRKLFAGGAWPAAPRCALQHPWARSQHWPAEPMPQPLAPSMPPDLAPPSPAPAAGASQLGAALMMLFFATIGASAGSLPGLGSCAWLGCFIAAMCAGHVAVLGSAAALLRLPLDAVLVGAGAVPCCRDTAICVPRRALVPCAGFRLSGCWPVRVQVGSNATIGGACYGGGQGVA